MKIRGETIIITSRGSKLSEEPIMIRLIGEFTSQDDEIKSFCFRNDLNVRLHKDGNYMMDLTEQLGFIVINIEEDLVYLSLPASIDSGQREKLEYCKNFFNGDNATILYYKDDETKEEFDTKILYKSDLKKMDFVNDKLNEYTKVSDESPKVLKKM